MHVELAVDAMELAARLDEIVLFSGDGDFRSLVEAVQRRGVRVMVVSSMTKPILVADDLRRQADVFADLSDLRDKIGRPVPEPPPAGGSGDGPRSRRRIVDAPARTKRA